MHHDDPDTHRHQRHIVNALAHGRQRHLPRQVVREAGAHREQAVVGLRSRSCSDGLDCFR